MGLQSTHPRLFSTRGFTLVEMSVVLLIISVVIGSSFAIATRQSDSEKQKITITRLDAIEKALKDFRVGNNRLPCPASGTLATTNANYGVEAATPGTCTGGTPAANFSSATNPVTSATTSVVGGTVPTVSLGLPKEYMYDGWGRRISYHVDAKATEIGAFQTYDVSQGRCFDVMIDDRNTTATAPTDETYVALHAAYALVSHGKDGHGAYTDAGSTRVNAGSTNTQQNDNADFSSMGVAATYNSRFVDMPQAPTNVTSTNVYDDFIRFKTRAQLRTQQDGVAIDFPDLIVAGNVFGSPMLAYFRCGDVFRAEAGTVTSEAGLGIFGLDIAPNNAAILTANYNVHFQVLYYNGQKMALVPTTHFTPYPAEGGAMAGHHAFWFDKGNAFMVAGIDDPAFQDDNRAAVYNKTNAQTYDRVASPLPGSSLLTAEINTTVSPDGKEMLVTSYAGNVIPELHVRNADNTFSLVANASAFSPALAALTATRAYWSPNMEYLVLTSTTYSGTGYFQIFKNNGNHSYSAIAMPSTVPANEVNHVSFSPDSRFMVVLEDDAGGAWQIYQRTADDTFDDITTPAAFSAAGLTSAWSEDGNYLAVGINAATTNVLIFKRGGATFNAVSISPNTAAGYPADYVTALQFRRRMPWEFMKSQ